MITEKEYGDFEILINKLKENKKCSSTFYLTEKQFMDTKDAYTYSVVQLASKYLECKNPYEVCNKEWEDIDRKYLHNGVFDDIKTAADFMTMYGSLLTVLLSPVTSIPVAISISINELVIRYGCIIMYKDKVTDAFLSMAKKEIKKEDSADTKKKM